VKVLKAPVFIRVYWCSFVVEPPAFCSAANAELFCDFGAFLWQSNPPRPQFLLRLRGASTSGFQLAPRKFLVQMQNMRLHGSTNSVAAPPRLCSFVVALSTFNFQLSTFNKRRLAFCFASPRRVLQRAGGLVAPACPDTAPSDGGLVAL